MRPAISGAMMGEGYGRQMARIASPFGQKDRAKALLRLARRVLLYPQLSWSLH